MTMSIGSNVWLPIALSLVAFGSFSWAVCGHFETSIRIPNGMRLLSFFSFCSYMTYIGLLMWRGCEPPVWTTAGAGRICSVHRSFLVDSDHDQAASARSGLYGCGSRYSIRRGALCEGQASVLSIVYSLLACYGRGRWRVAMGARAYPDILVHPSCEGRRATLSIIDPFVGLRRLSRANRHVPASYSASQAMTRPGLGGKAIKALWNGAAAILQRLLALRRLFQSYLGTENERPVRREQATILSGVTVLFAILGIGSCTLFTLAFEQRMSTGVTAAYGTIILLYVLLVAGGLRWRQRRDDAAFIRLSVMLLVALGLAWGVLVNLFALDAQPNQQGILIGLIMALVSTPMLAVPLSAALAFYVPISIFCSVVILDQPIQSVAAYSFFGFLMFALIGLLYMNKTILERSIGRLNLQKEHETIRVFLREYEEVSSDWLWETDSDGSLRNVGSSDGGGASGR